MIDQKYNRRSHVVVVVEDDEILSRILQEKLSRSGYEVFCLDRGEDLPHLLERRLCPADLVIMDILLPGKNGIYWLKWLKQYHPNILAIVASAMTDKDDRLLGLRSGADDYVIKPFNNDELLIRIEKILGKKQYAASCKTITLNAHELDVENKVLRKNGKTVSLTAMETRILQLLCLNVGKTVSREDMTNQIWGVSHYDLNNRTIDAHITKLRRKMEDDPRNPRYIRTMRGKGYCLHVS